MNFKFVRDLKAPPDDSIFSVFGNEIYASFIPFAGNPFTGNEGENIVNKVLGILPTPSFWNQGTSSTPAQAVPNSTLTVTSGGITINLLFDAAAMAAPASFRAGIQQAASILAGTIPDKITVNLIIDYSGTGGGASAGPDHGLFESYSSIRADLINNATPGDTTFNALPSGSSIQGQSNVVVWNAQLKLWGLLGANDTTTDDGSATFATDINGNLLVGVALHELTHAMGRIPYGPQPDIFDLFRFTGVGTYLFAGGSTAPAAYFSVDGGKTKLADYGRNSDPSDFLNSGVQGPNDPFNEYYTSSTSQSLTTVDKQLLDALGFHTLVPVTPVTTVIEAFGSTKLVQVGNNYFLDSISSGTGPSLKYAGAAVTSGQFDAWTPIGAEQTASGYEVAWKITGADKYTVWNTDSSGNYFSNAIGVVSGSSSALESLETSFQQDLNGDGVIGVPTVVIEALGSTKLDQVGNNYFLDSISSGTGPELKYGGAAVTSGQFDAWTPIGAEQTASGYEVAWKMTGADQYTVWNTDSSGNYTSNAIGAVSGTSAALESLEPSFQQDLNGDHFIGIPPAAIVLIEAFGLTKLDQVGNNYFLDPKSGGLGVELKYNGTEVTAGQFGGWTPIGAEATAGGGYEVAWKMTGVDQYTVWNTDSSGNYTSNAIGAVSGTSAALESLEPSFQQDLNGDHFIGIPPAAIVLIEAFGLTKLDQVGNNYFLDPKSGGLGVELKYNGTEVTAGQFGGWTPIGAEATAGGGYEVAWKMTGVDQYTVWNTDSSGNYTSNAIGAVSGTSAALESLEPSFQQDLNGDHFIGIPPAAAPAVHSVSITPSQEVSRFDAGVAGTDNLEPDRVLPAAINDQSVESLSDSHLGPSLSLFQAANFVAENEDSDTSVFHANFHASDAETDKVDDRVLPAATNKQLAASLDDSHLGQSVSPFQHANLTAAIDGHSDSFVFRPGFGAGNDKTPSFELLQVLYLDGHSSLAKNAELAALLNNSDVQPQSHFPGANDAHDTAISSNPAATHLTNVELAELQKSGFIIH